MESEPILLSPNFPALEAAGTGGLLLGCLKNTDKHRNKRVLSNFEGLMGLEHLRKMTEGWASLMRGSHVIVPSGHALPRAEWFTEEAFSSNFKMDHPEMSRVLAGAQMVGGGVWLCGGSVAATLQRPIATRKGFDDYDLFMTFGEKSFDVRLAWLKVHWLAELVRRAFTEAGCLSVISETLSKGCLTINISKLNGRVPERYAKVQIILRGFKGLSRILHGFDIPVCAVAVCADDTADGLRLYMTGLAAYSHAGCVFPVVPEYSSTSTPHRIAKYFNRGIGLEFCCFSPGEPFKEGRTITIASGLKLTPEKVFSPLVCSGKVSYGPARDISDYDREAMRQSPNISPSDYRKSKADADAILAGEGVTLRAYYQNTRDDHGHMEGKPLRFDQFSRSGTPLTHHILPRQKFLYELKELVRNTITKRGALDGLSLQKLGLSHLQIFGLMTAVMAVQGKYPDRKIDLSETLEPMVVAALARYDAVVQDEATDVVKFSLRFWIIDNPGAQFTGSLNPRSMTLGATYGSVYFRSAPLVGGNGGGAYLVLLDAFNVKQPLPCNDRCPLCMTDFKEKDLVIVLPCNHKYHSVETDECGGFNGRRIDRCPICRKDVLAETRGRTAIQTGINLRFNLSRLAGENPAREISAGENPAREIPAGEIPAREIPAREIPAGEIPAGEIPAREIPAREIPAREIPAHLSVSERAVVLAGRQVSQFWQHD